MGRPIRIEYQRAVYHVMARGNERRAIYWSDGDRKLFIRTMEETVERYKIKVYAYCLMKNHYHLLVETPLRNLSRGVGWLQNTYTNRFNRRHRRAGHLYQGRFKAHLVESDGYGRQLIAYIHLNPARIGIKKGDPLPQDRWEELKAYEWSSHRIYAGWKKGPEWFCENWRKYFGREVREQSCEYRKYLRGLYFQGMESPFDSVVQGLILGGAEFTDKARKILQQKSKQEEIKWLANDELKRRKETVDKLLEEESDWKMKIWIRIRLGQERMVDVGRELGYRGGAGISIMMKRLEKQLAKDPLCRSQLESYQQRVQK